MLGRTATRVWFQPSRNRPPTMTIRKSGVRSSGADPHPDGVLGRTGGSKRNAPSGRGQQNATSRKNALRRRNLTSQISAFVGAVVRPTSVRKLDSLHFGTPVLAQRCILGGRFCRKPYSFGPTRRQANSRPHKTPRRRAATAATLIASVSSRPFDG